MLAITNDVSGKNNCYFSIYGVNGSALIEVYIKNYKSNISQMGNLCIVNLSDKRFQVAKLLTKMEWAH